MNASAAGFFVSRLALGARAREEGQTAASLGGKACSEARAHSVNCLILGPEDFKANISLRLGALLIILRARAGSRRERMRLSLEACMCVRVYLLQHDSGRQTWTQGRELSFKKFTQQTHSTRRQSQGSIHSETRQMIWSAFWCRIDYKISLPT